MTTRPRWAGSALALIFTLVAQAVLIQNVRAQNVQIDVRDGVRYQVTTRTLQRTVPVTEMQDRHHTTYIQQITTENINHQQLYSVPVTQYRMVSQLRGRWNPFITPYWTHNLRPTTTWHQQIANVQIPVSRVAWVPRTTTVQVPVTIYRTAEVEETTRVAMSEPRILANAQPLAPTATIAARSSKPLGGVALKNDPPRQSTGGWETPPGSRYR